MSDYTFGGMSYRAASEMNMAIAEAYLSANGLNARHVMLDFLSAMTDEEMADECIEGWGLDDLPIFWGDDEPAKSWMGRNNVTRDDIVSAFADLRQNFDKHFPE